MVERCRRWSILIMCDAKIGSKISRVFIVIVNGLTDVTHNH